MFSKFKLNDINEYDLSEYETEGYEYYNEMKCEVKNTLKLIVENRKIDGTKLQNEWFPIERKFDVFLSHSHNDESLAISLAGYLKNKLDLDTFIDSSLWRYSNDLLKEIDNKYCMHSNGTSYDYNKRNYSTSHVHTMLSTALSRMIDNCETIFFLNTENSIIISEEINKGRTSSPWIYNELSLSDIIRVRPFCNYRSKPLTKSLGNYEKGEILLESELSIDYDVEDALQAFELLSFSELETCAEKWSENAKKFEKSLDYIYLDKGILVKKK